MRKGGDGEQPARSDGQKGGRRARPSSALRPIMVMLSEEKKDADRAEVKKHRGGEDRRYKCARP